MDIQPIHRPVPDRLPPVPRREFALDNAEDLGTGEPAWSPAPPELGLRRPSLFRLERWLTGDMEATEAEQFLRELAADPEFYDYAWMCRRIRCPIPFARLQARIEAEAGAPGVGNPTSGPTSPAFRSRKRKKIGKVKKA